MIPLSVTLQPGPHKKFICHLYMVWFIVLEE